jgi:hypothetical protein
MGRDGVGQESLTLSAILTIEAKDTDLPFPGCGLMEPTAELIRALFSGRLTIDFSSRLALEMLIRVMSDAG